MVSSMVVVGSVSVGMGGLGEGGGGAVASRVVGFCGAQSLLFVRGFSQVLRSASHLYRYLSFGVGGGFVVYVVTVAIRVSGCVRYLHLYRSL